MWRAVVDEKVMDETLKRRLVGAAVLAVIAIVIVPMLLDGPDWQQADDEPKVTTSRNAEGERVVSVSLNGSVPSAVPGTQQSNRDSSAPTTATRGPVNRNAPNGNSASSRSESSRGRQPAASAAPVVSTGGSRVAQPSRSTSLEPDRAVANSGTQSRPGTRPSASARTSAPAESSRSGWVVQLATFASEENANRLVDKLRAGGWSAWIEPMTSRTGRKLQQVRVGPERSQARASSSAEKLASKYKLKPQVLEIR